MIDLSNGRINNGVISFRHKPEGLKTILTDMDEEIQKVGTILVRSSAGVNSTPEITEEQKLEINDSLDLLYSTAKIKIQEELTEIANIIIKSENPIDVKPDGKVHYSESEIEALKIQQEEAQANLDNKLLSDFNELNDKMQSPEMAGQHDPTEGTLHFNYIDELLSADSFYKGIDTIIYKGELRGSSVAQIIKTINLFKENQRKHLIEAVEQIVSTLYFKLTY